MKKLFTLLLLGGAFLTVPVMAQDAEDVTSYIANSGFDEDLTWNADGTKKGPSIDIKSLSDRSDAYITEDSTRYATVAETTPKKRTDGRTFEATNGFIAQIQGWTLETNNAFPKCEWVYFGSVPYNLENQAIPIADDGTTYLEVPSKPADFDTEDNIGFAYLRAGWGGSAVYKQTVKLPCAQYRLEYWSINLNSGATNGKNLSKVTCRKETWPDETGFNSTEWTLHTIEFTPTSEFTMQFGFESSGGSNSNPFLCIDGIKLYKIGEADQMEILKSDLYDYAEEAIYLAQDSLAENFGQAFNDMYDKIAELQEEIEGLIDNQGNIEVINAKMQQLQGLTTEIRALVAAGNKALTVYQYIEEKILAYYDEIPGYADLYTYYNTLDMSAVSAEDMPGLADDMEAHLAAFWQSQEATRENPALYTFLVESPWFSYPYREPANREAVAEAGQTSEDLFQGSWVVGSQSGDQHKLYWAYDRTAFQLWNTNFSGYLDVHQELTGIPNGVYSLEADLVTNANARSDQHIYASSSLQDTNGYMTDAAAYESWQSGTMPEDVPWETVKTEGTVIVIDGKLTIGARSTQKHYNTETGEYDDEPDMSSGLRRGSFWMTNFILYYHGAATAEEIEAAKAARLQKANTLKDAMHFAADKTQVTDAIAKYNIEQDIDVLNDAIALAEASEAKYAEIMEDGKTIPTVRDSLANDQGEKYGAAYDIVKHAYDKTIAWIESQDAAYSKADSILNVMKGYTNTYSSACSNASKVLTEISSEKGKTVLSNLLAEQKTALLVDPLLTPEAVNELVTTLNNAIDVVKAQDEYEKHQDATDFTSYIKNADSAAADGWTVIDKGDGPIKEGQYMDDSAHKYFDSWKASGNVVFTMEQVIQNIPNGTYELKAAMRAPSEGIFLFTANGGEAKTDTTYVEVPLDYYEGVDEEEQPVTLIASDTHGPIWSAIDKKQAEQGFSSLTEEEQLIWNANTNKGRGWKWVTAQAVVENHLLVIGFTNNEQRTGKACTASWYSATDFSLTLLEKGDNTGWDGPITGISEMPADQRAAAIDGIYTLSGARVQKAQRGLYIIVQGGKSRKVIVK